MSVTATKTKRPTLAENRARQKELQTRLDDLVVETYDAGDRMDMDAWGRLRQQQSEVAKELASVTASIAQAEYAQRIHRTTPNRRYSELIKR